MRSGIITALAVMALAAGGIVATSSSATGASCLQVWGHQGAERIRPPNTADSFTQLARTGATGGEADVQYSMDGYPMIMHDATVGRATSGHGYVKDLTLAQLTALRATNYRPWNRSRYLADRVPSLPQVLAPLAPTRKWMLLDMHAYPTKAMWLRSVAEVGTVHEGGRIIAMGDPAILSNVAKWTPMIPRMIDEYPHHVRAWPFTVWTPDGWARVASSVLLQGPRYSLPLRAVSASVAAYYRAHGIALNVWVTDNPAQDRAATWMTLHRWGVPAITTGDPGGLKAWEVGHC